MYTMNVTGDYAKWFENLKDKKTKIRILERLHRIECGNFGDCRTLANNLWELKFTFAGGIRIYYTMQGNQVVLLLKAGNKSSQVKDIEKAKQILEELE